MGFWSRLREVFRPSAAYSSPFDPARSHSFFPMAWVPSTLRLSSDEATSVSAVWACIQVISGAVASSPWNVYEVTGRRRTYRPEDSLAFILNQRANPECTAIAFREAMMFGALAHGNAYAEIVADGSRRVTGLRALDPMAMRVTRNDGGVLIYEYSDPVQGKLEIPSASIFHLRGPVSISGLMGDSIVARASKAVALAAAAERFGVHYLANGAIPSMALKYPGKLDDKSHERIRAQWDERYAGPKQGGRPLILEGGMDTKDVSSDPQKAQLLDTQRWSVENIARYFSVPMVKLGVAEASQGYGTNLESINQEWQNSGLRPWCLRLEQEANAKLLSPVPYRETSLDLSWMANGNAVDRATADKIRIESGVLTVNEVREELGENTIGKEGDLRFISSTLTPLTTTLLDIQELAAKEPEPPAPADAPDPGADTSEDDGVESPVLRQALTTMVARSFTRYERKAANRAADLKKNKTPAPKASEVMAAERLRWRAELTDECQDALALARRVAEVRGRHLNGEADAILSGSIDALDLGSPAAAQASLLIATLLPEVSA